MGARAWEFHHSENKCGEDSTSETSSSDHPPSEWPQECLRTLGRGPGGRVDREAAAMMRGEVTKVSLEPALGQGSGQVLPPPMSVLTREATRWL